MMRSKRSWERYPQTYRAREMEVVAHWIRAGESGSIVGLAGAGKSNLLGFLCHQPQVMARRYLQDALKLALILVDLNNLPGNDLSTLYRTILRSLYEARMRLAGVGGSLPEAVQGLYRKVEDKADPFLTQSALREVLLSFRERDVRLVLVLDPFDRFCRTVRTRVLDTLRGLRDSFKATLSYVVGLRRELAYVRDPLELGELYEILDTHMCWLGPMEEEDARWMIGQVEEGMGWSFGEGQVDRLIALTGGYPALLRAASQWLAYASPVPDMDTWEGHLLAQKSVQNRLQDIWQGLTSEEQAALSVLQQVLTSSSPDERPESLRQIWATYQHALTSLQTKHLCLQVNATDWQVFSPLFARFVDRLEGISAGRIWYDPTSDYFFRGETKLANLSEKDRRLLHHFLGQPQVTHKIDDLIAAAWPEDESEGVTTQAVQQAIRHLRKQIEPNPASPGYLITEHRVGYRFFPEGAPRE